MSTPTPLHADPWAQSFLDLPTLNQGPTDAIVQAVRDLHERAASRQHLAPPVFVALGPAGVGKTHLFGRLRRRLKNQAVLVHVQPLLGSEMTPRFLLGQIVRQLGYETGGTRQLDLLVGAVLARARGGNARFPGAELELARAMEPDAREQLIEQVAASLLDRNPALPPTYVERLLRAPFAPGMLRFAWLEWLGGGEPDESRMARMKVQGTLAESDVVPALRTIAWLSASLAPLLVVFDQLENLIDNGGDRVVAYGNLVSELVNVVGNLVIVQMGLTTEWLQGILPRLGLGHRQRLEGTEVSLSLPNQTQRRELVELWLSEVDDPLEPYPLPLTDEEIESLVAIENATPRMLLMEMRRLLDGGTEPADPDQVMAAVWKARLAAAQKEVDAAIEAHTATSTPLLIDGLVCLGSIVDGLGALVAKDQLLSRRGPGTAPSRVALVTQPHPRSVGASLAKLQKLEGDLLALREDWWQWPSTWKATIAAYEALLQKPRARWHWLGREDVARLLAVAAMMRDARSGDLSGADGRPVSLDEVQTWMRRHVDAPSWPVVTALLGAGESAAQPDPETRGAPPLEPRAAPPPPRPPIPRPSATSPATTKLRALRVASIDRLVKELTLAGATATRSTVTAELKERPRSVRWLGEALVYWVD